MSLFDLSEVFKKRIRTVSLFGFGKSAMALLPHLTFAGYDVTVRDDSTKCDALIPRDIKRRLGHSSEDGIDEDLMIIAPSVRRDRFNKLRKSTILTSDTDIFFRLFTGKSFCISGSSGKSTSSTYLHEILSSSGNSHLIGNIGAPMTDALLCGGISRAVCEISSFNLQYDNIIPYRATVTNVKRNHLNWHKDFDEYIDAKLRLLRSALSFTVNCDDIVTRDFAVLSDCYACYSLDFDYNSLHKLYKDKIIFTSSENGILRNDVLIISSDMIKKLPRYNVYNLLSALSLADGEYDASALSDVIRAHKALSHRCEEFLSLAGVRYIDSSIDTSPDRTAETLLSLKGDIILLLGGRSKGESYSRLAPIIKEKCKTVLCFGEARGKIREDLSSIDIPISSHKTMREAALIGMSRAALGDTLLLSPASTSFDEFCSFEERGDTFKKIIKDAARQENTGDENEKTN